MGIYKQEKKWESRQRKLARSVLVYGFGDNESIRIHPCSRRSMVAVKPSKQTSMLFRKVLVTEEGKSITQ